MKPRYKEQKIMVVVLFQDKPHNPMQHIQQALQETKWSSYLHQKGYHLVLYPNHLHHEKTTPQKVKAAKLV